MRRRPCQAPIPRSPCGIPLTAPVQCAPTMTQVAIIGLSVLAIFFAILAAAGVFNGGKPAAAPVAPTVKHVTVTVQPTTAANTNPSAPAPAQTLKPGDTGSQVKILQRA